MDQSIEKQFRDLIAKYLAGNCTNQERLIVENWFSEAGNSQKSDMQLSDAGKEALLQQLKQIMKDRKDLAPVVTGTRRMQVRWRAAAIWAGLLIMGGLVVWKTGLLKEGTGRKEGIVQFTEIRTGLGEVKRILLPDSSEIWLNAHSTLQYNSNDFKTRRELQLSGEALFSVVHDEQHPFSVTTSDGITTRVLGTRFNIHNYREGNEMTVTVLNGKVSVNKQDSVLGLLVRQQAIRYHKTSGSMMRLSGVNAAGTAAWVKGEWNFDNIRLQDLAELLSTQYGVLLKYEAADRERLQTKASVNFSKKQSASEIVGIFCALAGCRYTIINDQTIEVSSSR